jgi:F-type H+-transporting ATPase subunit b
VEIALSPYRGAAVLYRCLSLVAVLGLLCAFVPAAIAQDEAEEPAAKTKAEEHAEEMPGEPEEEHATSGEHGAAGEHGAGDAGHEHDDTDLGHGNATAALNSPADARFDLAIYTFIVFLILLAILYKFAWGPIARALDQREETIARQIEEARQGAERATQSLKEYEARLGVATEEARQIVSQARKDAEVAKDRIVAEAREAAHKERDRAVAEIVSAKNQALQEIAQKSVATAVSLAGKIIHREVKPQDHEALIGDALNQFTKLN